MFCLSVLQGLSELDGTLVLLSQTLLRPLAMCGALPARLVML